MPNILAVSPTRPPPCSPCRRLLSPMRAKHHTQRESISEAVTPPPPPHSSFNPPPARGEGCHHQTYADGLLDEWTREGFHILPQKREVASEEESVMKGRPKAVCAGS